MKNMLYERNSILSKKIIFKIVWISTAITTVITLISFIIDYHSGLSELEGSLTQIKKTNLKSITESYWNINQEHLNIQLDGILTNKNIYSIHILNKDNKKLLEKKSSIPKPTYVFKKEYKMINYYDKNENDIGTLVIIAHKDQIFKTLIYRAIYIFITQTLKTLIVIFAMYLVFSKYIFRHIYRITEHFANVDIESEMNIPTFDLKSKNKVKDEIDSLVDSINKMAKRVSIQNKMNIDIIASQEKEIEEKKAQAIHSAKLAAIGEMAAGIAHEVNNPASVASLAVRSLRRELANENKDCEIIYNKLDKVDAAIIRISNIVKSIKNFSQPAINDDLKRVNLNEIITESMSFFKERYISENLEVICEIPETEIFVKVKQSEISQVILNLINNAHDAIKDIDKGWIKIQVEFDKDNVYVRVSDNGYGVPKEIKEKIFIPFFTTKETGLGTGIGLGLSRKLISQNNGFLDLDFTSKNTTFIITLPIE
jgi:C4-dicarboxylate-specific signal transduction histidine kinase